MCLWLDVLYTYMHLKHIFHSAIQCPDLPDIDNANITARYEDKESADEYRHLPNVTGEYILNITTQE